VTDTGHLITFEHTGTTVSARATALALGAAADHLTKRERPSPAAASLLRQSAAAVTTGGGSVDTIAASLEDLADVTLMLVLPDADLYGRYLAIAGQCDVNAAQLFANLASIGRTYNEVFGRMAGIDSNEDKESEDGHDR